MRIEIEEITDWKRVVNAARFTVKKDPLDHEPSTAFKKAIILAEHSPLRLLEFDIRLFDIPKYVSVHFVRHHEGLEKFVCTSRPDRNGFKTTRHEQRDDDPVNMQFSINAQALINISRVRLCSRAEATTRAVWNEVINRLSIIEPELAEACVTNCVYRGLCPEMKSCGFTETASFKTVRKEYEIYFKENK